MRRDRNRKHTRIVPRSPRRAFAALATSALALLAWYGSSGRQQEPIRAGAMPAIGGPSLAGALLNPLRTSPFRLAVVDFAGLKTLKAADLARSLRLEPVAMIDLDPEAVCRRLRSEQPRVGTCEAMRFPLNRLVLSVTERKAIAVAEASSEGLDALGARFALAPGEGKGLPRLSGDLDAALDALLQAQRLGVPAQSVHAASPDDIALELKGTPARLRVGAHPELGLQRWQLMLRQISLAELGAKEIDARFRGQVVLRARNDHVPANPARDETRKN